MFTEQVTEYVFEELEDDYNRIQPLVGQHRVSTIENIDLMSKTRYLNHTGNGKPGCFDVDTVVVN